MKKGIALSVICLFTGTTCFASNYPVAESNLMREGFFGGLGVNYNSINITQTSWGEGISNIQTNTGVNSNGIAQGTGAPFHDISSTLSPAIQMGYFKHFACNQNLYGFKFSYQYLNSTATNSNLYIPQLGQTTSITGVTSSLFGYVNADSVQVTTSNNFNLIAFIGHSFGNAYVYLGAGPALFNLKSKNYYSIGYADVSGVTINVTGLVSYSSPTVWLWGGAAQLGMAYFLSPSWFVDASYTYMVTGSKTTNHEQGFFNSSSVGSTNYITSGTLLTKDTLSVRNQSLMLSINKVF